MVVPGFSTNIRTTWDLNLNATLLAFENFAFNMRDLQLFLFGENLQAFSWLDLNFKEYQ